MIDFTTVTREIRSLVSRRRELLTFLGSVFAALGIFLQNVLSGGLPSSLESLKGRVFATYAFMLMVPSLLLGLRLARLNSGMTLNGILYRRLMQDQDFTQKGTAASIDKAARVNLFGVSFLMFLLAELIAGFSGTLLFLSQGVEPGLADLGGAALVAGSVLLYLNYHNKAVAFARAKAMTEQCLPFERDQWEGHQAGSLEDANKDMITILALVGLIVFSSFEGLSGLGRASDGLDIPSQQVQSYGPTAYGILMVVASFLALLTYIRLRVAVGGRSLELDPTDRPFRPLRLTDSLLGYMLLAFFFAISLHFLLYSWVNKLPWLNEQLLLWIDAAAFVAAIAAEQITLVVAGRHFRAR